MTGLFVALFVRMRHLASSLNVPAVRVLHTFGVEQFHEMLLGLGMQLHEDPWHYGLSMILGWCRIQSYGN